MTDIRIIPNFLSTDEIDLLKIFILKNMIIKQNNLTRCLTIALIHVS